MIEELFLPHAAGALQHLIDMREDLPLIAFIVSGSVKSHPSAGFRGE